MKTSQNTILLIFIMLIGVSLSSNEPNSIIVIPVESNNEFIKKLDTFRIDGHTIIKHLSSVVSAEKMIKILDELTDFDSLMDFMDDITIGDIYREIFPNGFLYAVNEKILKRHGLSTITLKKSVAKPSPLLHKIPIIPLANIIKIDNDMDNDNDSIQYDENVFDDVEDLKSNNPNEEQLEQLKESPITDDYINDQPIEERIPIEQNSMKNQSKIDSDSTSPRGKNSYRENSINIMNWLRNLI